MLLTLKVIFEPDATEGVDNGQVTAVDEEEGNAAGSETGFIPFISDEDLQKAAVNRNTKKKRR